MKSIWNGTLSFGLVNIPVQLYSAVQEHSLGFTMLCSTCHTPIVYERWCKKCDKEVAWNHIVKGLELKKGTYFIATPEKLAQMRPEKTDAITIKEFVETEKVDLIYFEKHYYVAPSKVQERAFFLFKKALELSDKVAIGTFVLREKEYVCVISPYKEALLLTTLNYSYEVRDISSINTLRSVPDITAAELKLAQQLIKGLTKKKFDMNQFKDSFAQKLLKAIKSSTKIKRVSEKKPAKKKQKENSLIEQLRASLEKK